MTRIGEPTRMLHARHWWSDDIQLDTSWGKQCTKLGTASRTNERTNEHIASELQNDLHLGLASDGMEWIGPIEMKEHKP